MSPKSKLLRIIGLVTVLGLGVLLIHYSPLFPTLAEAQSPRRLQIQATERGSSGYKIDIMCDTATGTLIYVANSGGVATMPNGCTKNPN